MLKNLNELIGYPFVQDILRGKLNKSKIKLFADNLNAFLEDENFREKFGFRKREYSLEECISIVRMIFIGLENLAVNQNGNPFKHLIRRISKPEARTSFSQILLYFLKFYFKEVFGQTNPHQLIQELKYRKAVVYPIGSVLRGTARVATSDIDVMIIYNSNGFPSFDNPGRRLIEESLRRRDYHPQRLSLSEFLAKELSLNPKYLGIFNAIDTSNRITKDFIFCEATNFDIKDFIQDTNEISQLHIQEVSDLKKISLPRGKYNFPVTFGSYLRISRALSTIFLIPKDFAFESVDGALIEHQKDIVSALAQLESSNPLAFAQVYAQMENFVYEFMLHEGYGEHGAPPDYYSNLIYKHAQKSGRFDKAKLDRASRLLKAVKRQRVGFPSFESVKRYFL